MLQRWVDHEDVEHKVLDDYSRNVMLIDLTAQPKWVKDEVDLAIRNGISHKSVGTVGLYFMKFCGKFDLVRLSQNPDAFARWMIKTYQGVLCNELETEQ